MTCPRCARWIQLGLAILTCSFASAVHAATLDEYPDYSPHQTIVQSLTNSLTSATDSTAPGVSTVSVKLSAAPEFAPLPKAIVETPGKPNKRVGSLIGAPPEAYPTPRILPPGENLAAEDSEVSMTLADDGSNDWLEALVVSDGELDQTANRGPLDNALSAPEQAADVAQSVTTWLEIAPAEATIAALSSADVPDGAVPRTLTIPPTASRIAITTKEAPFAGVGLDDPWESSEAASVTLNVALDGLPAGPENPDSIRLAQAARPTPGFQRPPQEPKPEPEPLPSSPSSEEMLDPEPPPPPEDLDFPFEETITISRFKVVGSTIFSAEELAEKTRPLTNRIITFADVLEVRSAITKLYLDEGYITSGAIVPPQRFQDGGEVEIRVIEGGLEDIEIRGTRRLRPSYIRSRLAVGASTPLNRDRLLDRLQLLQLNPLIENISADLQAGTQPGTNLLVVTVTEADSFNANYEYDNNRSPSVGSMRHQFLLTEANLLGFGDRISFGYDHTNGSDEFDIDYTLPLNPHDGTLRFAAGFTDSDVIEDPFDVLEIESESDYYELTLRQPLLQKPTQEFALGLTASHQKSKTALGFDDIGPFPLSPGADDDGRTRVSALRFFQEWTQRSNRQVIALRSQFSFGLDVLNATINDDGPDSRFLSWQGQGQWVRSLGADALLLLRGGAQLTTDSLLVLEQFGLGGQSTVRGYRQDQLLTDSGVLASLEVRLPVWRDRSDNLLLQVAPFVDVGHGWNNNSDNPDPNTLVGTGVGLLLNFDNILNFKNRWTARLDWGIPLVSVDSDKDTLQENGLYFSLGVSFF